MYDTRKMTFDTTLVSQHYAPLTNY